MEFMTLLVTAGAVQGLLLACALWLHPRGPRRANRIVAAFLFSITLALFADGLRLGGQWQQLPSLFVALSATPFLFGPLLWLYVETLTDPAYRLRAVHFLHAIPWLLNLLLLLPWMLMPAAELVAELEPGMQATPDGVNLLAVAKVSSLFGYTLYAWRRLRRWQHGLLNRYSNLDRINLRWLGSLLAAFAGVEALVVLYLSGLFPSGGPLWMADTVLSLVLTILVLTTGILALRQPQIFSGAEPAVASLMGEGEGPAPAVRPRRNLSAEHVPELRARLDYLMSEEALYLDRDLSLTQLATALSASPHQVSELLNAELGCTFYDYVNRHRVEAVQRRLRSEAQATVLDLALESGFNNKATFNKAFRRVAGCTPSEWRAGQGT
jgi:AraC-like DNA-binding protein